MDQGGNGRMDAQDLGRVRLMPVTKPYYVSQPARNRPKNKFQGTILLHAPVRLIQRKD